MNKFANNILEQSNACICLERLISNETMFKIIKI